MGVTSETRLGKICCSCSPIFPEHTLHGGEESGQLWIRTAAAFFAHNLTFKEKTLEEAI
jgi:hypothetical protein